MFFVIAAITYMVIRLALNSIRPIVARAKTDGTMTALNIPDPSADAPPLRGIERIVPDPVPAQPDTLCYECLYAHIVRGFKPGEELIACGYVFPMREVFFRVHECSDYRPKRERSRVEKANESAVCILPFDVMADNFHAAAATRNGEGEVESSYD
jgi:hypothetical protein